MCKRFGMSAKVPATVRLSSEEFLRHGGLSGPHLDGWGTAWHEERDKP
ncbi:MAG TPA: class II glutamine amidotransferase [Rubrivivax sp.]|nr:class II glutamine amidotransferase [Rubrivivax sp.]